MPGGERRAEANELSPLFCAAAEALFNRAAAPEPLCPFVDDIYTRTLDARARALAVPDAPPLAAAAIASPRGGGEARAPCVTLRQGDFLKVGETDVAERPTLLRSTWPKVQNS